MKVISSDDINSYVHQSPSSVSQMELLLQANTYSDFPINLIIQYTDSYHQDIYFQSMNVSLHVFLVDPPNFVTDPQVINADRWSSFTVQLPQIVDPNKLDWTVLMNDPAPDWVKVTANCSLYLDTQNKSYNIPESTTISVRLINEQKAWRDYNITILTKQYFAPLFGTIQNFTLPHGGVTEVNISSPTDFSVSAIDWNSSAVIPWISWGKSQTKLCLEFSNNLVSQNIVSHCIF